MFRFIMIIVLIAGLMLAWKTGILESIRSGAMPEIGRESYIDGPLKSKGVPVAIDPESLGREITRMLAQPQRKDLLTPWDLKPSSKAANWRWCLHTQKYALLKMAVSCSTTCLMPLSK